MKEELTKLIELQKLENIRDDICDRLKELPEMIEEEEKKVCECADKVEQAKNEIKTLNLNVSEKDIELKAAEALLKKKNEHLNSLKSNEAYKAMKEEISATESRISSLEDSLLELYEQIELGKESLKEQEAALEVRKKEIRTIQDSHREKIKDLEKNLSEVKENIRPLEEDIEKNLLEEYRKIRNIRQGIAIVKIEDESCGGCHIRLRPQTLNEAIQDTELKRCDNCSRFFYLEY